jgi:hypothetical protein
MGMQPGKPKLRAGWGGPTPSINVRAMPFPRVVLRVSERLRMIGRECDVYVDPDGRVRFDRVAAPRRHPLPADWLLGRFRPSVKEEVLREQLQWWLDSQSAEPAP